MDFAPQPAPKGYSYIEDAPRKFQDKQIELDPPSSIDFLTPLWEVGMQQVLKGKNARQATLFVQKGLSRVYATPAGKRLVDRVASVSLNKSVQGAAAVSHVSKILRTHGITSFGAMAFNDGKLFVEYCQGNIDGSELRKGLFKESIGQGGDMLGWVIGASVAGTLLCGPVGAAVISFAGSTIGRSVGNMAAGLLFA